MSSLPTRSEIDDEYTWDLSAIFDSPEAWEAERAAVEGRLDDLRRFEGDVLTDGEALLGALECYEEVLRRTQRLELYALLKRNEDTTDGTHEERLGAFRRLDRAVTKATDAIRREVQSAPADDILALVRSTDGLEAYRRFLEDLLRTSAHARSPEVEEVLADFGGVVESPGRIYTALTNNDVRPDPVAPPGDDTGSGAADEEVAVTAANRQTHLRHTDRAFRSRVYGSVYGAYANVEHTIATAYADKVKAQVALAGARNYDSVREMAFAKPTYPETGMRLDLPEAVHDTAIGTLRDNLDPLHRSLETRRGFLGVDDLRAWDLHVPLAEGPEPTVDYDAARDLVLEAVAPLGEAYCERLAAFLDEPRIDVYETERKQNIAGYAPSAYDTGAYLLLNYDGDVRSLSILAHELGHAMHASHLREANRPVYATSPRPIEEVPSYVHEFLLARHLMRSDDAALRRHGRAHLLEQVVGGLYGAGMHSAFTHESYRVVEEGGALTRDTVEELYVDLLSEFRAPMAVGDAERRGWLIGSYGREPYHFYQYVLGATAALDVVDRLLDGDLSPAAYREVLRGGGRLASLEAFEALGVDVRSPDPFDRATERFDELVSAVEEASPST